MSESRVFNRFRPTAPAKPLVANAAPPVLSAPNTKLASRPKHVPPSPARRPRSIEAAPVSKRAVSAGPTFRPKKK